jgi:hypothetical protein
VYGATVAVPMSGDPKWNRTEAIVPSGSLAVAAMPTVAGAANAAPEAGSTIATLGGTGTGGGGDVTVTLRTLEPLTWLSSVTVSLTEYVPGTA